MKKVNKYTSLNEQIEEVFSVMDDMKKIDELREPTKAELRDIEIMAAVDGEEGFGGEAVTTEELQSETAQMFARTGTLLRRLGTAILNEPVPQAMIDIVYKRCK